MVAPLKVRAAPPYASGIAGHTEASEFHPHVEFRFRGRARRGTGVHQKKKKVGRQASRQAGR